MNRSRKFIKPTKIYVEKTTDNSRETKQKGRPKCLVWGPLALTLFVSRLLGLAPLRFARRRGGWLVSVSPLFCIYSYILLAVLVAGMVIGIMIDYKLGPVQTVRARTVTANYAFVIEMAIVTSTFAFGVFSAPLRMKNMIENLNLLTEINVKFRSRRPYRNRLTLAISWIIGTNVLHWMEYGILIQEVIMENRDLLVACLYSCCYILLIILQVMEMQFVFLTFLVQSHLKLVNDSLKDLVYVTDLQSKSNPFSNIHNVFNNIVRPAQPVNMIIDSMAVKDNTNDAAPHTSKLALEAVRRLATSYGAICDVVREMDLDHGFIMLLLTGSSLLFMIVSPYYLVSFFFSPKTSKTSILLQVSFCLLHLFALVIAVEPGYQTEKEMETTEILVSHLMRRVPYSGDPLAGELDIFCKQIALNRVRYSTLGVVLLNRPLIAAVLGSATTYLVIILQFQALY